MRIIGGALRGKHLNTPEDDAIRPTAERTREALFNVLMHSFANDGFSLHGAQVLDACAGTGALGLEALSRGAAFASFLEKEPRHCALITANLKACRLQSQSQVVQADVTRPPLATKPCDLLLTDPPYADGLLGPALEALAKQGWLKAGALCVVEAPAKGGFTPPDGFPILKEKRYGKAQLTFLKCEG